MERVLNLWFTGLFPEATILGAWCLGPSQLLIPKNRVLSRCPPKKTARKNRTPSGFLEGNAPNESNSQHPTGHSQPRARHYVLKPERWSTISLEGRQCRAPVRESEKLEKPEGGGSFCCLFFFLFSTPFECFCSFLFPLFLKGGGGLVCWAGG